MTVEYQAGAIAARRRRSTSRSRGARGLGRYVLGVAAPGSRCSARTTGPRSARRSTSPTATSRTQFAAEQAAGFFGIERPARYTRRARGASSATAGLLVVAPVSCSRPRRARAPLARRPSRRGGRVRGRRRRLLPRARTAATSSRTAATRRGRASSSRRCRSSPLGLAPAFARWRDGDERPRRRLGRRRRPPCSLTWSKADVNAAHVYRWDDVWRELGLIVRHGAIVGARARSTGKTVLAWAGEPGRSAAAASSHARRRPWRARARPGDGWMPGQQG